MIDIAQVAQTVGWLRARGHATVALCAMTPVCQDPHDFLRQARADEWVAPEGSPGFDFASTPADTQADAVVIVDEAGFPVLMRRLEKICYRGKTIVPACPDWVVAPALRGLDMGRAAWETTPVANYLARNLLTGHYLEFGAFWGAQFFPTGFNLSPVLQGDFFAFDSFAGLSSPLAEEVAFTGGDFSEGAYACNQPSFEAIGDLVGFPRERLKIVPGFFSESLVGKTGADYGIAAKSVSYCVVDCDIYEPTLQVLDFVLPLLDDGALIYFDDWRLGRGSPRSGERGAVLDWMKRHPEVELVDFPGDHQPDVSSWQHAWFIFHRC